MKEYMTIALPLSRELMTALRLATGGVCSLAGVDLERSEDCKVCVTESLLLLMHAGYPSARVGFWEEDGLLVRVSGEGERGAAAPTEEDEISFALLGALAEQTETEKEGGALARLSFRFGK